MCEEGFSAPHVYPLVDEEVEWMNEWQTKHSSGEGREEYGESCSKS